MIGQTLGSYRLIAKLGEGGMGDVYRAEHVLLGKTAAVKLLKPELSMHKEMVQRFFNEAKATTLIKDPGIVEVFDFGYLPTGAAYFIMQLLEGESLASRLKRDTKLAAELAVTLTLQIARSLGRAHEHGIIHRDLKPDNVFLSPDREIACGFRTKLLDFGIAKLKDADVRTKTGAMMGTLAYVSPEQVEDAGTADARSDVYSLGCVLFEMVLGRWVFQAQGTAQFIHKIVREPPPAPRSIDPSVPEGIERVILRCLQKDPAARYPSMAALAADLEQLPRVTGVRGPASWKDVPLPPTLIADGAPGETRTRGAVPGALARDGGVPVAPLSAAHSTLGGAASEVAPRPPASRSRRFLLPGAAAAIVAAGVFAVLLLTTRDKNRGPAPAEPAAATSAPPAAAPPAAVSSETVTPASTSPAGASTPPASIDAGLPAAASSPADASVPKPASGSKRRSRPSWEVQEGDPSRFKVPDHR
jgi:serine/threonine-protein kinase